MNMVIVGGGKAAKDFLEVFANDETVAVVGVVDLNENAVGMVRAREMKIRTSTDINSLITAHDVNVVLEVTGSVEVRKKIIQMIRADQDIISAGGAQMMADFLSSQMNNRNLEIASEIEVLSAELAGAADTVDKTANDITMILKDNLMLALNAQIEAAHIGEAGASFGVIAEQLQKLFTDIQKSLSGIKTSSIQSHKALEHLDATKSKLRIDAN